jgi:3'(2'), 5'-bisphosphate nucleotidase
VASRRGKRLTVPAPDYASELACAVSLARQAGAVVASLRGGELGVDLKPGDEPVTIADHRASQLIVAGVLAAFPRDALISEELAPEPGALARTRVWLIDPIDGTKDFIRGSDGFAVMIGLAVDGQPVVGAVYQPTLDRLFAASPAGAYVERAGTRAALVVSDVSSAVAARLVASASHRNADIDRVKQTLGIDDEQNIGSVGIKLCLIASGARDLYVNPSGKTKAWDTCAPQAILERAGGKLTDLFGDALDNHELRRVHGLVASNGLIHAEVIAKLAPLFADRRGADS